jgi:hypothetical protein
MGSIAYRSKHTHEKINDDSFPAMFVDGDGRRAAKLPVPLRQWQEREVFHGVDEQFCKPGNQPRLLNDVRRSITAFCKPCTGAPEKS